MFLADVVDILFALEFLGILAEKCVYAVGSEDRLEMVFFVKFEFLVAVFVKVDAEAGHVDNGRF